MLSKNKILSILEEKADILKNYGVSRIGLFGSYLHGDSKEKSDIDLLVEFSNKTYKTFSNYMKLKFYLEDLFGCKVDLIPEESLKSELQPVIMEEVEYAEL